MARRLSGEAGATVVEYALLVALVTLAVVGALSVLGLRVSAVFCPVIAVLGGTCP